MRNSKIRFKYCTEENVDFIVKLPKEIDMTDIIEVLGNDEVYDLYNKLASYYYDKYKKKEKLSH